jgi:hypothetical protein
MSAMIIPVILMAVIALLSIPAAFRHDADLPISHTGKERK